jgi:hypothetical protein
MTLIANRARRFATTYRDMVTDVLANFAGVC